MPVFYERGRKYNCKKDGKSYFRTSVTINGKVKSIYGDGEKDALRKKEELIKLASEGFDIFKKDNKIKEVMKGWLFNVKRVDKDVKASSFERYEGTFRLHIEPYPISNIRLCDLSSTNLQAYLTELYEKYGLSTPTIKATLKVWKMFCKWAVDEGYLAKNPCARIVLPGKYDKSKRTIEVFTDEERNKIFNYMEESHYQYSELIKLAFATGMRQGELFGLRWSDLEDDIIHVQRSVGKPAKIDKHGNRTRSVEVWDTKTANSVRDLPILQSTQKMLENLRLKQMKFYLVKGLGRPMYMFTTETGELLDAANFRKSYMRMLRNAGVPYRKFHTIRHTFATEAIRRGVDVKDLQMLMGHSDVETTFVYVQSDDSSKRKAIERMGEII